MKRRLRIFWAHLRLQAYLLFLGMWRGECAFWGGDTKDRTVTIGAVTGSALDESLSFKRIFFYEPTA